MKMARDKICFTIPVAPVTKKNHGEIIYNKNTGKHQYIPSKQYRAYASEAGWYVPALHINEPVNIKAVYYKKDRRKSDLVNFHQALFDVMVEREALTDDNDSIIVSTDGSRTMYDKENPRTEVEITFLEEGKGE